MLMVTVVGALPLLCASIQCSARADSCPGLSTSLLCEDGPCHCPQPRCQTTAERTALATPTPAAATYHAQGGAGVACTTHAGPPSQVHSCCTLQFIGLPLEWNEFGTVDMWIYGDGSPSEIGVCHHSDETVAYWRYDSTSRRPGSFRLSTTATRPAPAQHLHSTTFSFPAMVGLSWLVTIQGRVPLLHSVPH
jgi:hypothetical protein